MRLMITEQVSKYHPDKFADQLSDAVVNYCLSHDPNSRVACETMVKNHTVVFSGEITSEAQVNNEILFNIATKVAEKLNYKITEVINLLGTQSPQINNAVNYGVDTGAGDQGIAIGAAFADTPSFLPKSMHVANEVIKRIEQKAGGILKGEAKCQVAVNLKREVEHILISVCHDEQATLSQVKKNIYELFPEYDKNILTINPAGLWTIGGTVADCGMTGRKIVCDSYGPQVQVGGGAFSGKDPSKVDRSAAYMARQIALDIVRDFGVGYCCIYLGYIIGQKEPYHIDCFTDYADTNLIPYIKKNYDLSVWGIIQRLDLLNVDYEKLSEGCHFRELELPKRKK